MKIKECNPAGLADPTVGAHVNPAMTACVQTLTDGLAATGETNAVFVVLVALASTTDDPKSSPVRVASNMNPEHVSAFLKLVANEGHQTLPIGMAHEMINFLMRAAKLRELSPADFVLLMHKVAEGEHHEHPPH